MLFDLGSHVLDLMYHFLGEYFSVLAHTEVLYKQRPAKSGVMVDIEADDAAFLIVRMKNGAFGTIEVSKIATGANDERRFEIHGDKGAIPDICKTSLACHFEIVPQPMIPNIISFFHKHTHSSTASPLRHR